MSTGAAAQTSPPATASSALRRWVFVLLFTAGVLNYVDRQVLALLKPELAAALHWSDADYAGIISTFQAAAVVGLVGAGWFLDRTGLRRGFALGVAVWSLAAAAHGAARTVLQFAVARGALGAAEAVNTPAAIKAVATWYPPASRSFVIGLGNAAPTLGAILTPLAVAAVSGAIGWRWTFAATGALGFVWVAAWLALPDRPPEAQADSEAGAAPVPFARLLRDRSLWAVVGAKAITDPVWWLLLFWAPDLLHRRFGLGLSETAAPLSAIYVLAALGALLGGWAPMRLRAAGLSQDGARRMALCGAALPPLAALFVTSAPDIWTAALLLGVVLAGHQAFSTNVFAFATDRFAAAVLGRVSALGALGGNIAGLAMLQVAGVVLSTSGSYATLLAYCAFAYLGAAVLVCVLSLLNAPHER